MLDSMPSKIPLANLPTPLRQLKHVSSEFSGTNIWLKCDDHTSFAMSGNKVRKLEYLLADAVACGAGTVVTCGGIQSNHCRATAFACAQLGLKCHLILRNDISVNVSSSENQSNHLLDQLAGASIELHEPEKYQHQLPRLFHRATVSIEASGSRVYCIPTGGSNGLGVWGYIQASKEIIEQCQHRGFMPSIVVCATGSGGTQAGLALGMKAWAPEVQVRGYAVCDSVDYFEKKIRADIDECSRYLKDGDKHQWSTLLDSLLLDVNDEYIGPGYALSYPEINTLLTDLAQREGVLLDPVYTGKAFWGMLSDLRANKIQGENIVFVHTGGAFALFSRSAELLL